VLDLIFEYLPVNQASVLLFDEATTQLMPRIQRAARGTSTEQIRISRNIANEAVTSKKAVLVMDAEQDPRFDASASIVSLGIRSAMAAPLCHKGKVSGLIYVDRRASHVFTHSHLEVLSILAGLSAAAVDKAMLHARIERERKIRERLSRYNAPAVIDRIVSADDLEACAMTAEERDVTVLFADISGFTSLSENMSARAVTELLNEIFEALTEEVFREGGTLDKFIGDAVMVFFGAPLTQEDHAERAVRVALAMQRRVTKLNASRGADEQLGIRIGINSGPVVVGDVGALQRKDYTVIGDTVNTACRIESFIAHDGDVVIGPATFDAVKDRFECRELPATKLKGKALPLTTYQVVGANGHTTDDE
jgi:adenylate cyclase